MTVQVLRYGEEEIRYQVEFTATKAKRITIHVLPNGAVRVEAPQGADPVEIKAAVRKRARWLSGHLAHQREQQREILPRQYVSGESHFYLGRRYLLKVIETREGRPGVKLLAGRLQVTTRDRAPETVKRLLWRWYVGRAEDVFRRRLITLAPQALWLKGQTPPLRLLAMKKQWGSCSPEGRLLLNPHLVKAPGECVDYVILHELCHLQEHNHSAAFYGLLSRLQPDWRTIKARLDGMAEQLLNA